MDLEQHDELITVLQAIHKELQEIALQGRDQHPLVPALRDIARALENFQERYGDTHPLPKKKKKS